ncbi:MAG: biotin--[acetyl-CoA-carboxylase] ligase [Alphaproteobacteria bacterium]|nr:biotin--[acetyl-CoA-carboxylase] ligase [Alphaproteobacteria bacterium]
MWSIKTFEALGSTQDQLKSLAEDGALEGLVIQALSQTKGRGRHGRKWEEGAGNLYMSILLRPECELAHIAQLSLTASLAIAIALKKSLNKHELNLIVKWPNDILINNKKCVGILPESGLTPDNKKIQWLALGIGVNIKSAPIETSCALSQYSGKNISTESVRDDILGELESDYRLWKSEGFQNIRKKWLSLSYPKGSRMQVKQAHGTIEGNFETIDEYANLILQTKEGERLKISSGELLLV